jgi:hypothetical protein
METERTSTAMGQIDNHPTPGLHGVNELQAEFEQRKMFITSWPAHLHDQLVGFVNNWAVSQQQYEEEQKRSSLHDDPHSSPSPTEMHTSSHRHHSDPPTLLSLWNSGPISLPSHPGSGVGVLAYEISLRHGMVIRTDITTEANTMWTTLYLHDILHSTSPASSSSSSPSSWTCYDFFCLIFPQFALLSSHLIQGEGQGEAVGKRRVGIKYFAHAMGPSSTASQSHDEMTSSSPMSISRQGLSDGPHPHGPPSKPMLSAYQTIGLLSDPAMKIIPRSLPFSVFLCSAVAYHFSDCKERPHLFMISISSTLLCMPRLSPESFALPGSPALSLFPPPRVIFELDQLCFMSDSSRMLKKDERCDDQFLPKFLPLSPSLLPG